MLRRVGQIRVVLLSLAILMGPATRAQAAVVKNLEFNVDGMLPSAEAQIAFFNNTGASEASLYSVGGGLLHQQTQSVNGNASYLYPSSALVGGGFDAGQTVIVEARVRVLSITSGAENAAGGAYFQIFDGTNVYGVYFEPGGIELLRASGPPVVVPLNIEAFHTYRLVSPGNSAQYTLYVDGSSVFVGDAPSASLNGFDFGDGFSEPGVGANAEWDYVRASQSPPGVPATSPATAAVLCGLLVLGAVRFWPRRQFA